jgi:L-asparaginase II
MLNYEQMSPLPLVEVSRGGTVESIHHGVIAVVNPTGDLLASWSDPHQITFMRSSAKPFQALPFLESGAAAALGIEDQELAMVCASHSGQPRHLEVLQPLLERAGLTPDQLQCGLHRPLDKEAARELERKGLEPSVLHNNCAGKHIGMLAASKHMNYALEDYLQPDHPLQVDIKKTLAEMTDTDPDQIRVGVDGCSAPNFALSLRAMALGFARLADPGGQPEGRRQALSRIYHAMITYPELVSGPGELDALLMKQGSGQLLAKVGAQGVLALSLRHPDRGPLGIAIKIWDGDPTGRALAAAAMEALVQLSWLSRSQQKSLTEKLPLRVETRRGQSVGAVNPVFQLEQTSG